MEADRQRVSDITEKGLEVDEIYSVRKKDPPRRGKKAGFFFAMIVTDASGDIRVNFWGGNDEGLVRRTYESIKEGEMVRVRGRSDQYEDSMVIQVNQAYGGAVEPAALEDYDIADFVPCTDKDPEEMLSVLYSYIEGIQNRHVHTLMVRMFSDPRFVDKFKSSPASVSFHCAWVGGLLEHTLNVLQICDFISKQYPELDRDLLLASAILHDVGKVRCYKVTTTITESVDGRLKGHIMIGAQMVEEACSQCPDFPETLRTKLVHMVLASHGTNEKGSPAEPSIPEALALHFADEMDAKLERFILARDNGGPGDVFVLDPKLGTKVFLG